MNIVNKDKILQFADEFCKLSLDELQLFITIISDKLNIDFSKIGSVSSTAVATGPKKDEKKSLYLVGIKEGKKPSVIKEVKNVLNLTLTEVNDKIKLIESSPLLLKADILESDTQELRKTLEEAGSILELR